jgi:hypothetical protein
VKTRKRLIAVVLGALGIVGTLGGLSLASARTPAAPKRPAVTQPQTAQVATAPDTDAVQQGDQTTPDTASESKGVETESTSEKAGAEEPGDKNLPGGGHADSGTDSQHEFDGVE